MLKDYINNKPKIESKRLILRPMVKEDVPSIKEWTTNKDVYKYWGKNPGKYDLKPELMFDNIKKPTKSFHLGIEYKKDKKIIGDIYIYLIEKNIKGKIAIRLNPKYHNLGLGTEAVNTMVNWCFNNTELRKIWTDVDINNIPSIKVLEKNNFKKIKKVIQGKAVSVVCDYYIYEINRNDNKIEFKKISDFPKGTLYEELKDAYSFNKECAKEWETSWVEYDNFFYKNLEIADKYGFITVLDGKSIGHISWDPRNRPDYAIIGHNCILTKYKGKGYGKIQLEEAIRRIKKDKFIKVIVTTNKITYAAQKNYESVGMKKIKERINNDIPFSGNYIDYELYL